MTMKEFMKPSNTNIMTLEAKPIIKNKFWIVENEGQQIATIQATDNGVVLVKDHNREAFANFKLLSAKYNIRLGKSQKQTKNTPVYNNIYGFPTSSKPYNVLYDVKRRLPFFTKNSKSKSFYCAGYYIVQINDQWTEHFCPKSITLKRYPYYGPYHSIDEMKSKFNSLLSD